MHYNKQIQELNNKIKAVWKIVKKETGKHSAEDVTPLKKTNDNAIENPKLFINHFNTYVLTIVKRMNNDTKTITEEAIKYHAQAIPKTFPNIELMPTRVNEIKSTINFHKSKCTCGYDEISTYLIKSCADYISVPLTYLCNQSMAVGVFPE